MLDGGMSKDSKSELYAQQRSLNQRRKATPRVERLEMALKRKRLQMAAFQEQLRKQLMQELEKYQKEQAELEQQLKSAKEYLQKLETGRGRRDRKFRGHNRCQPSGIAGPGARRRCYTGKKNIWMDE